MWHTLQAEVSQSAASLRAAEQRVQEVTSALEQLQNSHIRVEENRSALQAEVSSLGNSLQFAQVKSCSCFAGHC